MNKCRICKAKIAEWNRFCSQCGARQIVAAPREASRSSILSRLKEFFNGVFYEVFRSAEEKEFDAAGPTGSFDMAIPRLERIMKRERNNPRIRAKLAIFYAGAGRERVGLWPDLGPGPLGELRSRYEKANLEKAKEILSWVSKLRQLGAKQFSPYDETWAGLDGALDGSMWLFEKSVGMDPTYPDGYEGRACAFHELADGILEAHGILPYYSRLTGLDSELEGKPVQYGSAELGICIKQEMPDLDFASEVLWLYEQAIKDYKQTLKLDPTDTRCYLGLSHVLRQLGRENETGDYLSKALAILNMAIIADEQDKQSYCDRARVLGELAIVQEARDDKLT